MWSIFRRSRFRRVLVTPRRARLVLEQLETRDCPSAPQLSFTALPLGPHQVELSGYVSDDDPAGVTVNFSGVAAGSTMTDAAGAFDLTTQAYSLGVISAVAMDAAGLSSDVVQAAISASAPTLTLALTPGPQRTVTLSGQVMDATPGGLTVAFSGVASGSVVTSADGSFSTTLTATGLGAIQATTQDGWGLASNTAQVMVASAAPSLTLGLAYGSQRTVTLSGQVTDDAPGGLTVAFSGVASGSVVTNADGSFSTTLDVSGLGAIQAATQDDWGLASNTAQVTVSRAGPTITNFQATEGTDRVWTFQGQVADDDPAGLVVSFGGFVSLSGQTTTVGSDGSFALSVPLQAGQVGTATAQTTDWWGLVSNVAQAAAGSADSGGQAVAHQAPSLSLSLTQGPGQAVTLSGQVTDDAPGGLTITFGGVATGAVVTNADGSFSTTLAATGLGVIQATTQDSWGLGSNTAQVTVSSSAPTLTLTLTDGTQNTVTLSGQVTDDNPGGLTVAFSGVASGSVVTNADGSFCTTLSVTDLGVIQATTQNAWGLGSNTAQVTVSQSAPTLLNFQAIQGSDHTWTLQGQVAADNPAALVVHFGGPSCLAGQTATVGADGSFALTVWVPQAQDGMVTAQVSDCWGQESNVGVALVNEAPTLTLSLTYGDQRTVTLTGEVTAANPGGMTVNFTGVAAGSVTTNVDGTFSFQTTASGLGAIQATTQDSWGMVSNTAQVSVASTAPTITDFSIVQTGTTEFEFQGKVTDESPAGLIVRFSGLPSLNGQTATVQADGSFCVSIRLQPGEDGTVTAQTRDWWGLDSNQMQDQVLPA